VCWGDGGDEGDVFTITAQVLAENPAHYFQIIPD
jgi:hypothetical protein